MKPFCFVIFPLSLAAVLKYGNTNAAVDVARRGLGDDLSTDLILTDDDTHVKAENKRGLGDDLSTDLILTDDDTHVKAENKRGLGDDLSTDLILTDDDTHVKAAERK